MSFDPFEVRLHFLSLLRKLNASQQSIQTVTSYAAKYARRCGEDLWDCVMEECGKGNLNIRMNILYFLDTLCDPLTSLSYLPTTSTSANSQIAANVAAASSSTSALAPQTIQLLPYTAYLNRDLDKLIGLVVPETREGILNLLSAKQILESWRVRRFVKPETCEALIHRLDERRRISATASSSQAITSSSNASAPPLTSHGSSSRPSKRNHPSLQSFSRADKLRRMEEDRERHKRLRERMWVLPMKMPEGMRLDLIVPGGGGGGGAGGSTVAGVKRNNEGQPIAFPSPATSASPGTGGYPSPSPFTPASPSRMPVTPSESTSGIPHPPHRKDKGRISSAANRSDGLGANGLLDQLDPIDVEFDLMWEDGSDLDEEDLEEMRVERGKRRGIFDAGGEGYGEEDKVGRRIDLGMDRLCIPGLRVMEGVGNSAMETAVEGTGQGDVEMG